MNTKSIKNVTNQILIIPNSTIYENVRKRFSTSSQCGHDFSITKILREINVRDYRNAKSAILIRSEDLNFNFYGLLHFLKDGKYQMYPI